MRDSLLSWYRREARDLPWRRTRDPYAILVSEVMLQQTRVETVLAYYEPFLTRFPTIESLASAPIDDVLKAWEGLGYYRRAHNLHRAARAVADRQAGRLPTTAAELKKLPGIGPYTAAAVASIAFGRDDPVLDGNVVRVLSRLHRIGGDPARAVTRNQLLREAQLLVGRGKAADVNQALMDLGARICLPRVPECTACPVCAFCDAHHQRVQSSYPETRRRGPVPRITAVAGIIWSRQPFSKGAKLLIARRKADDMLGGLWEFPGGRVEDGETLKQALVRELHEELRIGVDVLTEFDTVRHAYTHFRVTLHFFTCVHAGGRPVAVECDEWAWVELRDLGRYAFPTADRKILEALTRSSNLDDPTSETS